MIEAQSTELDKQIAHARDFKDAETAHEAFLTSLIEQSFLDMPPLAVILEAIYSLCLGLCSIVQVRWPATIANNCVVCAMQVLPGFLILLHFLSSQNTLFTVFCMPIDMHSTSVPMESARHQLVSSPSVGDF